MEFYERNKQIAALKNKAQNLEQLYNLKETISGPNLNLKVAVIELTANEQLHALVKDDIINNNSEVVKNMFTSADLHNLRQIEKLYLTTDKDKRQMLMQSFYIVQRQLLYKCLLNQEFISKEAATYFLNDVTLNFSCYQDKFLLMENYQQLVSEQEKGKIYKK